MPGKPFPALEGFYGLMYLYMEPVSTMIPALIIFLSPNGAAWFHGELVPGPEPTTTLDPRSLMAIWQLSCCFCLLGLLSAFGFRAVRDSLPNNPVAQERIIGAALKALAIGDVAHIVVTIMATPQEILRDPSSWNGTFMGNIPFTFLLLAGRLCWFAGIGRKTYYYSVSSRVKAQ
ncbi:hypothetical protein M408DRAFT_325553 [Serendipita vermifera MAFF 305830]|uniref:DUF7704 domain-containing protein n=1 Tax=Serendipita vermifera MAFF 305830 TaxID=933852 RepID=A0A0C2XYT0_SERVB|nr:hypothetical protein M408DRAFT_334206 [Serendipita vermifera MAFF 305830]KIM34012.1 hypothetical protein M408DRAFT_325553 [Serendipita vermifera MAFF 305830]